MPYQNLWETLSFNELNHNIGKFNLINKGLFAMHDEKISDADVPRILKGDGVGISIFDQYNKEVTSIPALIEKYGRKSSWSHTLVNSDSNSATLIAQMPGEGNRRHFHPSWDEWWYIVEGQWEWEIEGAKKEINAGELVFIERNRKHKITSKGDRIAIRIAVSRYDVAHVYDEEDYK